jgi:hypothetical protein
VSTAADGSFATRFRARRNTRLRAVLADTGLASTELQVYADHPTRIRRLGAGGPRPRAQLTMIVPRGAPVRRHAVTFYVARRSADTWKRVDQKRWRVLPKGRVRATGSYPAGRLGRRDDVLICTPEPRHDGYGRPSPIDASCGSPRIARATGAAAYVRARAS